MKNPVPPWAIYLTLGAVAVSGWIVAGLKEVSSGDTATQEGSGTREYRSVTSARTTVSSPPIIDNAGASSPTVERLTADLDKAMQASVPGLPNDAFLRLVDETMLDNDQDRRNRNFALLLSRLRPEDAPGVHEELARMHSEGRPFPEAYDAFSTRYGEIAGVEAIEFLTTVPTSSHNAVVRAFRGWAQGDARAASGWLDTNAENYDEHFISGARYYVTSGWARRDPAAATDWVIDRFRSEETDGNARPDSELLKVIMLETLYARGIDGASAWIASLPDDDPRIAEASAGAWQSLSHNRLDRLSPEIAASTWSKVGDRSWVGIGEFSQFYDLVQRGQDGDDQAFYSALQSNGWDEPKLISQFERWSEADPEATSEWLAQKSPGDAVRQVAIAGMLRYLDRTDPAAAGAWRTEWESRQ